MRDEPFRSQHHGGVLMLTLDTPGCAVNILDNTAARQLISELGSLDARTRAVVIKSGKAGSFVNGAGLLMAMSVQKPRDAGTVSATVRRAYDAIAASPVPVVAAVRGSCYGCGVELVLRCRLRLAADGWDTHFYMTEISEYLFTPVFGGTVMLPLEVGLAKALDLTLWGERWSGKDAARHGLVDAVLPDADFDDAVLAKVERQLGGMRRRRRAVPKPPRGLLEAHAKRIAALPQAYQEVYRHTLAVMRRASEAGRVRSAELQREIEIAGISAAKEQSKRAMGLFLVRQTADALARARRPVKEPVRLSRAGPADPFWRELERRRVSGLVELRGGLRCGLPGTPGIDVALAAGRTGDLPLGAPLLVYGPARLPRNALLELAEPEGPTPAGDALHHVAVRLGFHPVRTRARGFFVIDRYLRAWLEPGVTWLLAGGAPSDVHAALRQAGVVRGLDWLLERWDLKRVARLLRPGAPNERLEALRALAEPPRAARSTPAARAALAAATGLEATAVTLACLEDGTLPHPSVADVIARELGDFPLACGTLGTAMTRAQVKRLLGAASDELVRKDSTERLRVYAAGRRDFYL